MFKPRKPLIIIQGGSPPDDLRATHGEQAEWMLRALDVMDLETVIVRPHLGEDLPSPLEVSGAILTGSWAMVTDREPWSERTGEWIRCAMAEKLPMLGICYGHQLMSHALGGEVGFHPAGREIGQHQITLKAQASNDLLFSDFPAVFPANLTHEQTVLKPPMGAIVLASSFHDPHQIIRYSPQAISVQFHPEFDVSLMSACLVRRQAVFEREGYKVSEMVEGLIRTDDARSVLRSFVSALT